jgi:hypothetical protein
MTQYPPEVQKRRMQQLAVAAVARQCLQETSRRAARTVDGRAGTYFHMFLFLSQRSWRFKRFAFKIPTGIPLSCCKKNILVPAQNPTESDTGIILGVQQTFWWKNFRLYFWSIVLLALALGTTPCHSNAVAILCRWPWVWRSKAHR